jgi:hypothetical protein
MNTHWKNLLYSTASKAHGKFEYMQRLEKEREEIRKHLDDELSLLRHLFSRMNICEKKEAVEYLNNYALRDKWHFFPEDFT